MRRWFRPILAGASLGDRALAAAAALAGIALTALLTAVLCRWVPVSPALPVIVAPMGASAVLVFAVPASPLAQPWAVVGGNTVSALVGIAAVHAFGSSPPVAGLAVGGAILAMSLARCLHPPGGAAALTAVVGGPAVWAAGWSFAALPVAANSLLLLAAGWLYHRVSGHSYPHRPVPAVPTAAPDLLDADIDVALERSGETFDIDRDDLIRLLRDAEQAARDRRARQAPGRR